MSQNGLHSKLTSRFHFLFYLDYLGKIGEKRNAPLLEVIGHYQQCAQLMEENFQFLKRVNKGDQSDFEPLELYYCIHSFLNKRRVQAQKSGNLIVLRQVVECLELFSEKNVSKKADEKTPNFSIDLNSRLCEVGQSIALELSEGCGDNESSMVSRENTLSESII